MIVTANIFRNRGYKFDYYPAPGFITDVQRQSHSETEGNMEFSLQLDL